MAVDGPPWAVHSGGPVNVQTHSLEFLEDSFPFIYSVASFGNPSHVLVELAFLLFCFPSLCLFMPFLEGFSHNTCVEIFTFFIFERAVLSSGCPMFMLPCSYFVSVTSSLGSLRIL